MALSELEQQRVEKIVGAYCRDTIPPHVRDEIRVFYTIRGNVETAAEYDGHPLVIGLKPTISRKIDNQ